VLTAEGTTSKGTRRISCEVEFCIFYRLSLRTLRTKDVEEGDLQVMVFSFCIHSYFVSWSDDDQGTGSKPVAT
jgi:hypothetical protein